ncbi:HAD-IIIC family phosphatase [Luteimonas sp. MJ246]|uniref:HAD-IIIC family phosphatase n=1 Tax=Luteimonas sp. MJ174 TaxID=3129237 RepID=UPI0031B9B3DE
MTGQPPVAGNARTLRCLLLSDFNTQVLANHLAADGGDLQLAVDCADYGQVAQVLADPGHGAWQTRPDCTVAWARAAAVSPAFGRLLAGDRCQTDALLADVDAYAALLVAAAEHCRMLLAPAWVAPASGRGRGPLEYRDGHGIQIALARMNVRLSEQLQGCDNVLVLDAQRWLLAGGERAHSPKMWFMGKVPYGAEVFAAAAADIRAALRALQGRSRKLVVVDLDNTLWGGVVGDVGWQALALGGHHHAGEAFAAFQEELRLLKQRGVVLAIASKNTEAVALEAIDQHPEMRLRRGDFAGWRINWADKAANIADLAAELRLGLDSVVFIDDNPVERERVRSALPEVLVPDWPRDPMLYAHALRGMDCFDALHFTAEDADRADAYARERVRRDARARVGDLASWLRGLGTRVTVEPLSAANLQRAAQLLNKTNQMNLRTRRMAATEFADWAAMPGHHAWTFRVDDRFGDSGLTGIASLAIDGTDAVVADFVLSCRVMGRQIEEAMLAWLLAQALRLGAGRVVADFVASDRNQPCLDVFMRSVPDACDAPRFTFDTGRPCPIPESITLLEPDRVEEVDA